jgi:hypothetical protein
MYGQPFPASSAEMGMSSTTNSQQEGRVRKATTFVVASSTGALIAATVTYVASFIDGLRTTQLDFVKLQIEKLYGPLNAFTQYNATTWDGFAKTYIHQQAVFVNGTTHDNRGLQGNARKMEGRRSEAPSARYLIRRESFVE